MFTIMSVLLQFKDLQLPSGLKIDPRLLNALASLLCRIVRRSRKPVNAVRNQERGKSRTKCENKLIIPNLPPGLAELLALHLASARHLVNASKAVRCIRRLP